MDQRLKLQAMLEEILGSSNVYFQPPESKKMKYPAIVYKRAEIRSSFGDNIPYLRDKRYQVTVIDANPDSEIVDKVSQLPMCKFLNHFTSDNLNHDVFSLIY